ncbi:MAG: hypothetical protein PHO10_12140 [Gemmiger sp.]|nr:hypothetical protein [Gemmiger sp.]
MKHTPLRSQAALAVLALFATAAVLTGATYAWFTLSTNTNVEPMQGSVSKGDVNLMIAATENGDYDVKTALTRRDTCEELLPLSTADLLTFYAATAQTKEGISVLYTEVTDRADTQLLHGEAYLKAQYADADVFFDRSQLKFEGSAQLLSALRLGMKITGAADGEHTYFFKLDDVGGAGGAAQDTTGAGNSVVSAVSSSGGATFVPDPAEGLAPYCAEGAENTDPTPGEKPLCRLTEGTPAKIEIWLYMEGCDENCLTEAAANNLGFNLAFAGVGTEDTGG